MFSNLAIIKKMGSLNKRRNRLRVRNAFAYILNLIIVFNSVGVLFVPSVAFADPITPEQQARINAINKAQWDGALSVKSFTLPTANNSPVLDPEGNPVENPYLQSDGTYSFSSIQMSDMFQGFNEAEHNNYYNELQDIQTDPHLLQDQLYQFGLDTTTYQFVECDTLATEAEQQKCIHTKRRSLLQDSLQNPGKNQFGGQSDQILTDFAAIADGTHPYYTELQDAECVSMQTEPGEGDEVTIFTDEMCIVPTNASEQICEVERYLQSTKIAEKSIMSYGPNGESTESSGGSSSSVTKVFKNPTVDDINEYPKSQLISVLGRDLVVEFDAFDQLTYPSDEYFPTNYRLQGTNIDAWSIETIGRPTNRYEYVLNVTFAEAPTISTPEGDVCNLNHLSGIGATGTQDGTNCVYTLITDEPENFRYQGFNCSPVDAVNYSCVKTYAMNLGGSGECVPDKYLSFPDQVIGLVPTVGDACWYQGVVSLFPLANALVVNDGFTCDFVPETNDYWCTKTEPKPEGSEFNFQLIADMHLIDEQGFRPIIGEEPVCNRIIEFYRDDLIPAEAVCDFEITPSEGRLSDDGVPIDWVHIGYFGFMPDWQIGNPSVLPSFCYEATITVDTDKYASFGELNRGVACSGLSGDDYEACINGQYCSVDAVNGGVSCHDIGADLQRTFAERCATLIADPACTYQSDKTLCQSSIIRDGVSVCTAEAHVFSCDTGIETYNSVAESGQSEVQCGTPRNCVYGECSNIAQESNDAFVRATAAMQVVQDAKDNGCEVTAGTVDENTCRLFSGTAKRCTQPSIFGAANCCSAAEMGMAGMDVVAYWKLFEMSSAVNEKVGITAYMKTQWQAVTTDASGTFIGDGLGAINKQVLNVYNGIADPIKSGYNFITEPIKSGWDGMMSSLGFSPETLAAPICVGPDCGITEALANTAAETVTEQAVTTAGTELQSSSMTGIYQYLAQGINYVVTNTIGEEAAQEVFVELADGTLEFADTATGEFLASAASVLSYVMLAYQIYSLYNLAVNIAFACDEESMEVTQKKELLQTHFVGSYCSKDLFIGGCIERSLSHCVYNSTFSRIMSQQLNKIIATDTGTLERDMWLIDPSSEPRTENLKCDGFTLTQITSVDFDRVDLSEYEEIVLAKLKYDPNNMPEDFVKSAHLTGAEGPQQGATIKESGAAQARIVSSYGDNRFNADPNDLKLGDPDYMAWFEPPEGPADEDMCMVQCDAANSFVYDTVSGLCQKSEFSPYPATISCDTAGGFVPVLDPEGNTTCQRTEVTPLILGCKEGYELDIPSGQCTKDDIRYEEKISTCPTNYRLSQDGSECELYTTADKVRGCSAYGPGFILEDGLCVQSTIETVTPLFSCANNNYNVVSGECVLSTEISVTLGCAFPLVFDQATSRCIDASSTTSPAVVDCSVHGSGYVLEGQQCVDRSITSATASCDVGYSLVGNKCEKTIAGIFPASSECPDGYQADPNDDTSCFKRSEVPVRPDPYCEDPSFTLVGNICERVTNETEPPIVDCDPGFSYSTVSNLCERNVSYAATIVCSDPNAFYNDATGFCEGSANSTQLPTLTCSDPAHTLVSDICYDYVSTGFSKSCPSGYDYNAALDVCEQFTIEKKPPLFWCPPGTTNVGSQCYEYLTVPASISCPLPSIFNTDTNMCEETQTVITPPTPICLPPSFVSGETNTCITLDTIPANLSCPFDAENPYTLNTDNRTCSRSTEDVQETVFVCDPLDPSCQLDEFAPVDFCLNGVPNAFTGECEEFDYTYPPANIFCNLATDTYNPLTNRCERVDNVAVVPCASPWGPDFVLNTITGECENVNEVPVEQECADGFAFDGTNCKRVTHSPAACSDPGMTYNSLTRTCTKTITETAVVQCHPPYENDPANIGACRLPASHTPLCANTFVPSEYNSVTNRCEHVGANISHTPSISCPSGTLNQDDTACYGGTTSAVTCPSDHTFNSSTDRCEWTPTITQGCTGDAVIIFDALTGTNRCQTLEQKLPLCEESGYYYDSSTNECVNEDVLDGTPVCAEPSLPSQYATLEGSYCKITERTLYTGAGFCPADFYPATATFCERVIGEEPPEFTCPADYIQNNAASESPRCIKFTTQVPTCDAGYSLVGDRCQKYSDANLAIEKCSYQGDDIFGDACLENISTAPLCQSGKYFSPEHDTCLTLTSQAPIFGCLSNNFAVNSISGLCESTLNNAPYCEAGYTLIGDLCVQNTDAPICDTANGFLYDANLNTCRYYDAVPSDFECAANERDTGTGCIPYSPPICDTANGWTYEPENDRCFKQVNQPYQPNCNVGFIDHLGLCVQTDPVDCAAYHPSAFWDAGAEQCVVPDSVPPIPQACSGPNEVLIGNDCFNTQTPSCSTPGYTFSPANDRCETTQITPAVEVCSNGATPPLCEDTVTYPGTCPAGYIATGPTTCERTTQIPSIPTCSAGLTYNHVLNQCTDASPVTPVLECGDDADGNPINGCTTIVDNPAFISCNTGYTYNSSMNRCEDVNTATKICSNGSLQPDGTCATERGLAQYCDLTLYSALGAVGIDTGSYCLYRRFAADPGAETSALQGAGFTCTLNTNPRTGPVGTYNCTKNQGYYERCDFTDVAGVCLEIFGSATCPSGYSPFNNTQCRQVLTQTPTCTNGYTWTGSTCQNEEDNGSGFLACTSPRTLVDSLCQLPSASYSCPSGATFINNYAGVNNDRCVTTNVDTISKQCPSGGTLQSSGMCLTTGTGDIEYSCPLGTLIVDQCHETLIQPPSCNAGFSYDPSLNVCRENVGDERPYICPSASPPYIQNGSISCDRNVFEPPFCSVGSYDATLNACVSNSEPYNPNCVSPFIDTNGRCEAYYPVAPTCPLSHPNYNGTTDTCDAPQQPYGNTCDAYPGYTLMPGNPSVCEIEILSSATCPIGSQEVDGTDDLCKTFTRQPADDQCDSLGFGTVRAGSQCQTYYENTSLTCNSGSRLDLEITNGHFQCHLPETQSMTTQCPFTGFTPSGLTCEELVSFPLNLQCPNGYELLTNAGGPYCEQILTDIMPEFQCSLPSNLLLDQQACRALDINPSGPIDQVCQSEEFIFDAVEGVCRVDPGNVPANEYCANPFYVLRLLPFPVDGRSYECVGELIETIDAIESCPSVSPPYTPTGNGSCSRELPAPATYMCGPNATLNIATNMCEEDVLVVTPPEIECPEPYSVSNGQCVQTVTSSAIIACDDNIDPITPPPPLALSEYSIVNGLCEKKGLTDTQPPIETCNGTIDPEGNCMGSISYPATPECDELNGYFYSAGTGLCQKTGVISELPVSIDCLDSLHALTGTVCTYVETLPDNGPVCPKYGDRYDSATNLCYRNYIDYEQAVLCLPSQDQRFNKCYERVNVAVDYSCPQSTVLIPPDQCEGTFVDRIDPDLSCSIGFLLGTSCIIEDKQRPAYSCSDPSYTLLNTICYQDIVVTDEEPIKTCPAGYTMTVTDTCIFEDIQPALAECPDSEYIYDSATKLCQREVSERYNPTLSCPSTGHIWFGVDAKTCERVINTSPVTQTCEDPSADGSGEQCLIENLLTHAPDYCIFPAQQVGSVCETYTQQRPEVSCPALPNVIKTFNGCQEEIITTQAPITTCP